MSLASHADREGPVVDQPGGNVALDLFVLDQHLGQLMDQALVGTGITGALYAVYSQLATRSLTPGQLSQTLGVRPTTLSGYLAAMERSGHLTRVRHQSDGRSRVLALTEAGLAQWQEARPPGPRRGAGAARPPRRGRGRGHRASAAGRPRPGRQGHRGRPGGEALINRGHDRPPPRCRIRPQGLTTARVVARASVDSETAGGKNSLDTRPASGSPVASSRP